MMECFDDSVTFLLANQSLSFQRNLPNKKARLYIHRAFVQSDQNNSQIFYSGGEYNID